MNNSTTICYNCNKTVPVSCGYCVLCGNVFIDNTLAKSVTVTENDTPRIKMILPKCVNCGAAMDPGVQAARRYKLSQAVRLEMGWPTAA